VPDREPVLLAWRPEADATERPTQASYYWQMVCRKPVKMGYLMMRRHLSTGGHMLATCRNDRRNQARRGFAFIISARQSWLAQ
jgi:hypothetical protein